MPGKTLCKSLLFITALTCDELMSYPLPESPDEDDEDPLLLLFNTTPAMTPPTTAPMMIKTMIDPMIHFRRFLPLL